MKKQTLNLVTEIKTSIASTEKVQELYGHIYAAIAQLYADAQIAENPDEANSFVKALDNNFATVWQEFTASQARVKIMGAAVQQKAETIADLTQEIGKLQGIIRQIEVAQEKAPVYTNGHKNGRR